MTESHSFWYYIMTEHYRFWWYIMTEPYIFWYYVMTGTLLDAKVWINAFTQDAFDCGAGWGKFLAYAALMDRSEPVIKYAVTIPIFNNIVRSVRSRMLVWVRYGRVKTQGTIHYFIWRRFDRKESTVRSIFCDLIHAK